eukprot:c1302_g1_i1.p1 GENE.c1302_g1_i1~~c1302_g1_i1.p1  ORF type:complete len:365 (+),score=82.24 c1302_g1_i1:159-1253(+)
MGSICSTPKTPEEKQAVARDKDIQLQHKNDVMTEQNKIKLLLLGAGESGKSAIFKQIKVLYGEKPSHEQLTLMKQVIHSNVMEAMKAICEAAIVLHLEDQISAKNEWRIMLDVDQKYALTFPVDNTSRTAGDIIKVLWADPGIRKVWDQRSKYQVVDSHSKFLDEIDRLKAHDFMPTIQDSVLARIRTTGIVAEHFVIEDNTFALYDVGGQRNERKKWIHVFDNVTSVIFVAALSEYDQTLFEDNSKNRMVEALELFEWICNHKLFQKKAMILFLNKMDLFQEKIAQFPISSLELWQDYKGGSDFTSAWQYFYALFHAAGTKSNPSKDIYTHITCATDPTNVQHVFMACKDVILKANLADSGLI